MATSAAASSASQTSYTNLAYGASCAGFVLIGGIASLYGPLLVTFTRHFHVSLAVAGASLSVQFVGSFLGVSLAWLFVTRLPGRFSLSSGMVILAVCSLASAWAAHEGRWTGFIASVFGMGVGFGVLDFSLNALLARTAVTIRAHRLSLANAGYGLGAVLVPLCIVLVRPSRFAVLLVIIAVLLGALSFMNGGVHAPALREHRDETSSAKRGPVLLTFTACYVLYVAVETSTSGWMATQLHGFHYSPTVASLDTAGFWLALTIGRVAGGPLSQRLSAQRLIFTGLALTLVALTLSEVRILAPFALPIIGVLLASVYAMGLFWYTTLVPNDNHGLAIIILVMMVGGVVGPGGVSLLIGHFGVRVIPVAIGVMTAATLALFASARRFGHER